MALRTDGSAMVVDDFAGVNNSVDEVKLPPPFVRWSTGGYYTERQEFERIQGKKIVGTSTAFGLLLCLKQLDFRGHSVVVSHSSHVYFTDTDLSALRRVTPPSSTLMDSFMVP